MDWRTEPDQMLHPRITAGVIADKLINLGSHGVALQYDQNGKRQTSGMFERSHARFFLLETDPMPTRRRPDDCLSREELPPVRIRLEDLTRRTLSVDAANSLDPDPNGKTSAVGLGVLGSLDMQRVLLDDYTRVLGPSATYRAIYTAMCRWVLDMVLVEAKALGNGVIEEIRTSIKRGWYLDERNEPTPLLGPDGEPVKCIVEPFNPGKDGKPARARAMLPQWEQGLILLRDGAPWLYPQAVPAGGARPSLDEGLVEEVGTFTGAGRTDRVDYLAQYVAYCRANPMDARAKWKAMSRLGIAAARRMA